MEADVDPEVFRRYRSIADNLNFTAHDYLTENRVVNPSKVCFSDMVHDQL